MKTRKMKSMRIMAQIGIVLLFLPIVFTLLTSLIASLSRGEFLMDYLMPAELFILVLIGAILLIVVGAKVKIYLNKTIFYLIAIIVCLAMSQIMAVVLGLAHGDTEVGGWETVVVIIFMALYVLVELLDGILGIKMIRTIKKSSEIIEGSDDDTFV